MRQLKGERKMIIGILLSLLLAIGSVLGTPENFGDTPGLNRSETESLTVKPVNPVQHSE
jgi:hypothetical protein